MNQKAFIDLHSHYVFGLDDGAQDLQESLAMIEQAARLNIEVLLATPHATDLTDDRFSEQLMAQFNLVKAEAQKAGLPVRLEMSAEMFYSSRTLQWLKYPWGTFLNKQRYLLFELPLFDLPEGVGEFIFQCRLKNVTPILAHPERYIYLHDKIDKLFTFAQQGCLMQINAGSIVGQFGKSVEQFAFKLLKAGLAHFVASDAHETEKRNYHVLIAAREVLEKTMDEQTADRLFYENPLRALEGKEVENMVVDEQVLDTRQDRLNRFLRRLKQKLFS